MSSPSAARTGRWLVALTALALAIAATGPVASASADSCRGSAAREATNDVVTSEPVVANSPGTPCATESADATETTLPSGLVVTDASAATRRGTGVLAGSASIAGASFAGDAPIVVGRTEASQTQSCAGGASVASGSSSVTGLVIGGVPVAIPSGQPFDMDVGAVRVRANLLTGDIRQALVLNLGTEQIVLGEASAGGDACAATDGGDTPVGGTGLCPAGASFDVASDRCVIAFDGGTVVVSKAFEGPVGGTVMPLVTARALAARGELPRSRCLDGAGPDYVVLGTAKAERIAGTPSGDRILGLGGGDRLDGGRGADCIDGNAGGDRLYGGTGRDRVQGGTGVDRMFGQAGSDRLRGGAGGDRIFGASGDDHENGGAGDDRVVTGSGRDTIDAGAGSDYVNAVSGSRRTTMNMRGGQDRVFIRHAQRGGVRNAEVVRFVR